MKSHILPLFLGLLLLSACTPTITPTAEWDLPPYETGIPSYSPPPTPLPDGETLPVTSTADSGPGSLRQALEDAQPYDTITFDPLVFPPDTPATLYISSELPHISVSNLTLDASNAGVILDGSRLPGGWIAGLQIVSSEASRIMGLQISNFPGPGIAISGAARHNIIGGDLNLGDGPFGQGNLISNSAHGIDLSTSGTTLNTITGNLIGTDITGTQEWGNRRSGIWITEGAHGNTIGPGNHIAHNSGPGIEGNHSDTRHNTITQNSIHDNNGRGIELTGGGNAMLAAPVIIDYDLPTGTVTGAACPNCSVEIFSDKGYEGGIFEGRATADDLGIFTLTRSKPFSGPHLTATNTDLEGTTSEFSQPTSEPTGNLRLQIGSDHPITQFLSLPSADLADNRIAIQFDSFRSPEFYDVEKAYPQGLTRARVAIAGMEPELVDWDKPEFSIDPSFDDVFTRMAENGLTITYVLTFWDKLTYPGGEGAPCARFQTEEEIERYLEFVRFTVDHFKDRVEYFEFWNEPDISNYCPKWIRFTDYVNLVKRTVPVIREVYPEAKIVLGGVANTRFGSVDYLFALLESELLPLVDVISWHPMYGASPEYEEYTAYYYGYPALVQRIKDTATANGFVGEYQADELTWRTESDAIEGQPWVYNWITASKYFSRSTVMHLGMDVGVGIGSDYLITPNLCTAMAGAEPVDLPVEIQSTASNIMSYTFALPDGGSMVALWTNGIAVEYDPGVEATLTIPDFSASEAIGIDILYGFEQELTTETENGGLVIRNLMVRDYPIIIRFSDRTP